MCVSTYRLVVVLEGGICVSSLERVVGGVIPCNVINPVGFVVVSEKQVLNLTIFPNLIVSMHVCVVTKLAVV